MVGTYYGAPEPGAKPYVVGGRCASRRGRSLCIIEAMKIMNEIESEFAGVVTRGARARTRTRWNTGRRSSASTRMADPRTASHGGAAAPAVPAAPRFNFKAVLQQMVRAERVRPAPQGRAPADAAPARRARAARHAADASGGPEDARRAADDAAAGEGVRGEQGVRLRHRRAGHRPLSRQRVPAARHRSRYAMRAIPYQAQYARRAESARRCSRRSR